MSNKTLTDVINEHNERVIRDAWFEGVQYGIELGRKILNGIKIDDKAQEKERQAALDQLNEKWHIKEEKTKHEE